MAESSLARKNRILIGALSGQKMGDRRERCRATWMADVRRHPELDAVFLFGSPIRESYRIADELHLPCPDVYGTLPQRTRRWCQWSLEHSNADYFFKCDDDTYVAVDRLMALDLKGVDYLGRDIGGWASGGAGYILSRRAAEIVAEKLDVEIGSEDLSVGKLMSASGIPLRNDDRFMPWPSWAPLPSRENQQITGHAISPAMFEAAHRAVGGCDALRIVIPVSNSQIHATAELLEEFGCSWPHHPPVDLIHHELTIPTIRADRQYYVGGEAVITWCDGLLKYLELANFSDLVLLYCPDVTPSFWSNRTRIRRATSILKSDLSIAACYLTGVPDVSSTVQFDSTSTGLRNSSSTIVSLKPAIWRRRSLIRLLQFLRGLSRDDFETVGNQIQRTAALPELFIEMNSSSCGQESLSSQTGPFAVAPSGIQSTASSRDIHPHGYWLDQTALHHAFDFALAQAIVSRVQNQTVVDLGCGPGNYVEHLRKLGIEAIGFDGNPNTRDFSPFCRTADLARPIDCSADIVLSLEVGEHLPVEFEQQFLENCCCNAEKELILSWAIPGQGGHGHFNERDNAWVIAEVESRGLKFQPEPTNKLREAATLGWFKNTLMVFQRDSSP